MNGGAAEYEAVMKEFTSTEDNQVGTTVGTIVGSSNSTYNAYTVFVLNTYITYTAYMYI